MKKTDPLPVRLDLDVKEALTADAAAQERSQAWIVNRILRAHYVLDEPKRAPPEKKRR